MEEIFSLIDRTLHKRVSEARKKKKKKPEVENEVAKVSTSDCSAISYEGYLLLTRKKELGGILDDPRPYTVNVKARMTFSSVPTAMLI